MATIRAVHATSSGESGYERGVKATPVQGRVPGGAHHVQRGWRTGPRQPATQPRLHDRCRLERPVHPGQLLGAVRPHRSRARGADRLGPYTRGRARAGDRDHVAFQHARVRRAQPAGASGGRCDGDGDAALPRGNHSRARGGDLRILQPGLGGARHPDHDPGRAGERHPVVGCLSGAHGTGDPERSPISRSRWLRQRPSCAR